MKTDYYELLGVESVASDAELKKAYRKCALRLHPDKNPDDIENATRLFNEIRSAYETLKDPQERSWYDSHKFQILMEDEDRAAASGGYGDDSQSDEVFYAGTTLYDIQSYLNPNLYQSFDDSINGFYSIITVLLDKIASEEVSSGKQQNLKGFNAFKDDTKFSNVCDTKELLYPRVGNSKSPFDDTRMFYKIWSSFQSVKTFNWCDEYRYSAAPDRRTRRLMEKENKKLRDQARKDYNETVRKLITFIKKLDPRMDPTLRKKFEKEKQSQKMEDLKKQAEIDKQNRKEQRSQYVEQSWQSIDPDNLAEIEEELARIHEEEMKLNGQNGDGDEDGDDIHYECIICNKVFKSEKQFQDHERSKKHLKLLKKLQWEMKMEGIELGIDDDNFVELDDRGNPIGNTDHNSMSDDDGFEDAYEDLDDLDLTDLEDLDDLELQEALEREFEQDFGNEDEEFDDIDDLDEEFDDIDDLDEIDDIDADLENLEIDDDLDEDFELQSKQTGQGDEDDITPISKSKQRVKMTKEQEKLAELEKLLGKTSLNDSSDDEWPTASKPKAKKKSKKKDKVEGSPAPKNASIPNQVVEICSVCNESFPSRNKLFQHVDATGHAAPPNKKGKKGKKGKKK